MTSLFRVPRIWVPAEATIKETDALSQDIQKRCQAEQDYSSFTLIFSDLKKERAYTHLLNCFQIHRFELEYSSKRVGILRGVCSVTFLSTLAINIMNREPELTAIRNILAFLLTFLMGSLMALSFSR